MGKPKYFITLNTVDRAAGNTHDCSVESRYNLPAGTSTMYKMRVIDSSIISSNNPQNIYIRSSSFAQPTSYHSSMGTSSDIIGKMSPQVYANTSVLHFVDNSTSPTVLVSSPQLNQPINLRITSASGTALTGIPDYQITLQLEEA